MDKIAEFLGKIFTGISVADSLTFLGISAITFLLGLLFGAWSRAGKIRRLKKEVEAKDTELKNLKVQYDSVVADYEKKEEILKKSEARISEMNEDVSRLTNERMHYKMELNSARQHLEQLQAENLEYATQGVGGSTSNDEDLDDVNTNFEDDEKTDAAVYSDRLALIEEKLEKLELENSNLRDEMLTIETRTASTSTSTGISSSNSSTPVIIPVGSGSSVPSGSGTKTTTENPVLDLSDTSSNPYDEMPPEFEDEIRGEDEGDMSPQDRANRAKANIAAAIGTRIPSASSADKDDLKSIDGVGPFIEKKLNDVGIYTFEQVSQLDAELIQHITDAIQFFPGRIEKDDWMGQARGMMG